MNIKKYYLGGHSFGGYIGALCAYKNRKGLKGLYKFDQLNHDFMIKFELDFHVF